MTNIGDGKEKLVGDYSPLVKDCCKFPEDYPDCEIVHPYRRLDNVVELEDGARIEYDVFGPDSAPEKIVWIMGFMASRTLWCSFISKFLRLNPAFYERYQMLTFDNRGVGGTSAPSGRYTNKQMASDTLQVVNHLNWEKFHVVGISMGGMIAQELSILADYRIISLSLLVTHSGGHRSYPGLQQLGGHLAMAKTIFLARTAEDWAKGIVPTLYSKKFMDERMARSILTSSYPRAMLGRKKGKATTLKGILGQMAAIQTHRVADKRIKEILAHSYPILLVGARRDRLIHHSNAAAMYQALASDHTRHIEVDGGHGLLIEDYEDAAAALVDTFNRGTIQLEIREPTMSKY